MNDRIAVSCKGLYKRYDLYRSNYERFKGLILPHYQPEMHTALENINLDFNEGEIVGLIGLNGSGKSTLANIIAGISMPTSGGLTVIGEPSLIAISSGLNQYLTGMENITLKGLMIGLAMAQIDAIRKEIVDFADVGDLSISRSKCIQAV